MSIMEELNAPSAVEMIDEDGCETLTVVDMGEMISLSQVLETDELHNVVIGLKQAKALKALLDVIVGE